MRRRHFKTGGANVFALLAIGSALLVVLLSIFLWLQQRPKPAQGPDDATGGTTAKSLTLFCAAGMRYVIEPISAEYQAKYDVRIEIQYAGSNTLLNQIEVTPIGDLYLAADDTYIQMAREKGLAQESMPLAKMRPVILVPRDNPNQIDSIDDLLDGKLRLALGDPKRAAVGKTTRKLLTATQHWERLEQQCTKSGVFKPTVNDVANAVKIGAADAGIVWDSTAAQYPDLVGIRVPELDAGEAKVQIAVLTSSKHARSALHFARFVSADDRGLSKFRAFGYDALSGDAWAEVPELTFFAGSVNRRAIESAIEEFEQREGVRVNCVYNGCGILTAQMDSIRRGGQGAFPDSYMACDVYYLDTVQDWFEDGVEVSSTDIVMVVQSDNPKHLQSLADLKNPGVRLAVGHPQQCTIGVLTRRLLQSEDLWDEVLENNVVTQTPTSALLVTQVLTQAADVVLAYRTDAQAEIDRLSIVEIRSPLATAVQPFSIARDSNHKQLSRRLFSHIASSREAFEQVGFNWILDEDDVPQWASQK